MILDIHANTPPSAFRGLSLRGTLMDTINQLAAVFHLHMYHCPAATPLKWLDGRTHCWQSTNKNILLLQSEKRFLLRRAEVFSGLYDRFFIHKLMMRLINVRK